MIIELAEWLWEHWEEVTLNALLLFILRKFILSELKHILRIGKNDTASLANQKVIMRVLGVENEWSSHEHGLNFTALRNSKKWLPIFIKAMEKQKSISRRKAFMEKLKSRKFWLTILAALIPVINEEFKINLDLGSIISIMTVIMAGVAALAHVDAKKILAGIVHTKVTVKGLEVAYTTFQEAIPYLKEIHADINDLLDAVKKDDGSQAFKDAMHAYAQIKPILDAIKHPKPVTVIVEDKVAS